MRDSDLEAVGREPARVVEVFIAIASATSRTPDHDFSGPEIAHDSIGAGIRGRGILSDVSEVASIRGDQEILI